MVKLFFMTIELSTLENKVKDLTQELALEEKARADEQKRSLEKEVQTADENHIPDQP